jgi:hypothetical protein
MIFHLWRTFSGKLLESLVLDSKVKNFCYGHHRLLGTVHSLIPGPFILYLFQAHRNAVVEAKATILLSRVRLRPTQCYGQVFRSNETGLQEQGNSSFRAVVELRTFEGSKCKLQALITSPRSARMVSSIRLEYGSRLMLVGDLINYPEHPLNLPLVVY